MSLKRVNSTGRKKINAGDISVHVHVTEGAPASFRADLRLNSYSLPGNALVFIEASRLTTLMRFPYGTVARPGPVNGTAYTLNEFSPPDGVRFRIKVSAVHPRPGLLLASGEVRPYSSTDQPDTPESLLPPHPGPLGDEVWQVQFAPDGQPSLVVNERLLNWRETVLDPVFRALVFPTALRIVLKAIGPDGGDEGEDEDSLTWEQKWIGFAERLAGDSKPSGESVDEFDVWVESAVSGFARNHSIFSSYQPSSMQEVDE